MLLQKARIGKTAVLVITLILLGTLAALPLFLQADNTGEGEHFLYLPSIFNDADGTPNPGTEVTATPTFTATSTIHPTITASATATATNTPTPTVTPSSTPVEPYIVAMPDCGPGPNVQFNLQGYNWPTDQTLTLLWQGTPQAVFQANMHTGSFNMNWTFAGLSDGIYTVSALSGTIGAIASDQIFIPCGILPTNTPTPTETPTPTSTPVEPYIVAVPDCGPGPNIVFNLQGANWPVNETLTLSWQGSPQMVFQANMHPGSFNMTWTFDNLSQGGYVVTARSGTSQITASDSIYIPCDIRPTNTPTPTNTAVSNPADLIVGPPILVSTPPIIVYEPVAFQVPITNTGDIAIDDLFFVDLLFDPQSGHPTDVYAAVSGLDSNSSMTLTITSTIGFANFVGTHQVTGWVDSLDHVAEADETNNLSEPLDVPIANFGGTPTNTPAPNGTETISGIIQLLNPGPLLIERAAVTLIEEASGDSIASTYTDEEGAYSLSNIPTGPSYTVQACIFINNQPYFGLHTGVTAPDALAHVFLQAQPCP